MDAPFSYDTDEEFDLPIQQISLTSSSLYQTPHHIIISNNSNSNSLNQNTNKNNYYNENHNNNISNNHNNNSNSLNQNTTTNNNHYNDNHTNNMNINNNSLNKNSSKFVPIVIPERDLTENSWKQTWNSSSLSSINTLPLEFLGTNQMSDSEYYTTANENEDSFRDTSFKSSKRISHQSLKTRLKQNSKQSTLVEMEIRELKGSDLPICRVDDSYEGLFVYHASSSPSLTHRVSSQSTLDESNISNSANLMQIYDHELCHSEYINKKNPSNLEHESQDNSSKPEFRKNDKLVIPENINIDGINIDKKVEENEEQGIDGTTMMVDEELGIEHHVHDPLRMKEDRDIIISSPRKSSFINDQVKLSSIVQMDETQAQTYLEKSVLLSNILEMQQILAKLVVMTERSKREYNEQKIETDILLEYRNNLTK